MDKIIESLSKLLSFEKWGWKREIAEPLFVIIFVALTFLTKLVVYWRKIIRERLEDLSPQFDHSSIEKAKQYFIPTQYQNASPCRQEEPRFTHQYIARNKLIPFFIKTAFKQKTESERFYLILADSGMGKTTFIVNLFLRYHKFFNFHYRQKMKLFRLADPDTIRIISSIPHAEAKQTILLLDALDEDRDIISKHPAISDVEAFRARVDEIIDMTKIFAEVIITCRTQYFPGQEEDPYELKIKRPDEKGFYTLNKLYISPFTDKEVRQYLNKKYGRLFFINGTRKRKALKIVNQAENLVIRPMLLSYIDYLLDDTRNYKSINNIYDTLVSKWLIREAEKRKGLVERATFVRNLERLSQNLAIALYMVWKNENRLFLSKEETLEIASRYNIQLNAHEITGQSLLTCDGQGNWKFAHKSIMEFFLAKEVVENPGFLRDFSFTGMNMAHKFYAESEHPLIHIDNGEEFYIYSGCIGIAYNSSPKIKFKLQEAMNHCNAMNKKNGYSLVYDDNGNFIDSDGDITKEIKNIRGFRLPTCEEWDTLYSKMIRTITSSLYSAPEQLIPGSENEWCFDTKGAAIKKRGYEYQLTYLEKKLLDTERILKKPDVAAFRMVFIP